MNVTILESGNWCRIKYFMKSFQSLFVPDAPHFFLASGDKPTCQPYNSAAVSIHNSTPADETTKVFSLYTLETY
jgi:hypothetical protein